MTHLLTKTAFAIAIGAASSFLYAQTADPMSQGAQESGYTAPDGANADRAENDMEENRLDPIDVEDFVDTASAKGIAEIETGKIALENGSENVREFARKMIEDHEKANQKLAQLAQSQNVTVSDDATLMDKAKAMILQVRDGESFDEAYINNQINAHEEAIELFRRAAHSDHGEISKFAEELLPKLEEHLRMARELRSGVGGN